MSFQKILQGPAAPKKLKNCVNFPEPEKGFRTALFLEIPSLDTSKSPSPRTCTPKKLSPARDQASVHYYLPIDLMDKIECVSPAIQNSPILSQEMSDTEEKNVSHESFDEEDDEMYLDQYEGIKFNFTSNPSNGPTNCHTSSTETNHKSSSGSLSSGISNKSLSTQTMSNNKYLNQMQLYQLQYMQNFCYNVNTHNSQGNKEFNSSPENMRKLSEQPIQKWYEERKNSERKMSNINTNGCQTRTKKKKNKKKKASDEFTVEMFGRRGWICEQCNNFNYESRNKCNRCGIPKQPKKITKLPKSVKNENEEVSEDLLKTNKCDRKGDWSCFNCKNLNFAFRLVCNRCQMKKEDSEKAYEMELIINSKNSI